MVDDDRNAEIKVLAKSFALKRKADNEALASSRGGKELLAFTAASPVATERPYAS